MNRIVAITFSVVASAVCALPAPGVAAPDRSAALLARAEAFDAGLRGYSAAIRVDLTLQSFPYLHTTLVGTYYHQAPDRDKIVFTSGLPGMAQAFSKVYPHIESPSQWDRIYRIAMLGDDGAVTTFQLVPRKQGRVAHLDVRVDDATAAVVGMRWDYVDGGFVEISQRYGKIGGYYLPTYQEGRVEIPLYRAAAVTRFGDYRLNPSFPPGFFDERS